MAGRALAGGRRWNPDGLAAGLDRGLTLRKGPFGIIQGRHADAQQPCVIRAELGHRAVQRSGPAVFDVKVGRREELRPGEGGEDQLAGEAEVVERLAPLDGTDGAIGRPSLGSGDDVACDLGGGDLVLLAFKGAGYGLGRAGAAGLQAHADQSISHLRICVSLQKVEAFHDVTVGIVDDALARVGHDALPHFCLVGMSVPPLRICGKRRRSGWAAEKPPPQDRTNWAVIEPVQQGGNADQAGQERRPIR